jgi:hypothetical protein
MVVVAPLSPDSLADFLAFFGGDAFSDNPAWSSCYCQCFYEDHTRIKWSARAPQNRNMAIERCVSRQMQGYLAYCDGKVVGWCNAAPRRMLHALDAEPIDEAGHIGCIVCFLVSPLVRGKALHDHCCWPRVKGCVRKVYSMRKRIRDPTPGPVLSSILAHCQCIYRPVLWCIALITMAAFGSGSS